MTEELMAQIKSNCEVAEGRVPYLYLDTEGNVTVGIGHLVPTIKDALDLPLIPFESIRSDFLNVEGAMPGLLARAYVDLSKSRMTDAAIDQLLESDLLDCQDGIRSRTPIFDSCPDPAQAAFTDMGFNLGVAGLFKFKNLWAAAARGDWSTCANECHRKDVSDQRNAWTANLFRQAAS